MWLLGITEGELNLIIMILSLCLIGLLEYEDN